MRGRAVAAALVRRVDEQPPQEVRAEQVLVELLDVVADHHETNELLAVVDRPDRGLARGSPAASSKWLSIEPR